VRTDERSSVDVSIRCEAASRNIDPFLESATIVADSVGEPVGFSTLQPSVAEERMKSTNDICRWKQAFLVEGFTGTKGAVKPRSSLDVTDLRSVKSTDDEIDR